MSIYLDHNATTPLDERVLVAMQPYLAHHYGNPSSPHAVGKQARAAIEVAREQVAELVNAHPSQVIFTSGGTEANNLAIKGFAARHTPASVAISAIEHSSVIQTAASLQRQGWRLDRLPVTASGRVDLETLRHSLNDETRLLSIMYVNNESGVVQDIPTLAQLARERGVVFHTDAVQAAGKRLLDFQRCGAQMMSLSAHKLYGPKGAGALIVDKALDIEPLLHGGSHEKGRRAGTENVPAIVGFGMAAELARLEMSERVAQLQSLRDYFEAQLAGLPGIRIFASEAERVVNTSYFAVAGIDGETLLLNLDHAGFAVASGSACESGSLDPSHVLLAMGVEREVARSALRVSFGIHNTRQQIDAFITALRQLQQYLRAMASPAMV